MAQSPTSPSRRRALAVTGGAAILAPFALRNAFAAEYITIATGGTSGVYYPLGVALSQIYTKAIPAAKSSVQATKGSVENLSLLEAGRAELGFSLGDALSDAWKGEADAGFKAPLKKLRTMAAIYSNYVQIVAREPIPASKPWPISRARAFRSEPPKAAPNSTPAPCSRLRG